MRRIETSDEIKTSFAPLAERGARILILGSLPGERSLGAREYYAHPQNRFWRILAKVTGSAPPTDYGEKKALLKRHRISIWDVVGQAKRNGSLDSNITDETPNDLDDFLEKQPDLRVIGFNGQKAEKLFDKYFERRKNLRYISLPSSSPANARMNLDDLSERWRIIFDSWAGGQIETDVLETAK